MSTNDQFSQVNRGETSVKLAERIWRVENGFVPVSLGENEPPFQLTLLKLMELYKVPGLSVAMIDDFKIAWAKGYGVTETGMTTPVTTRTLFQAGSVSKPVAATGALYLVEQGKLSLDEDVNQRLVSWKVPENEFTRDQKVTLRRILSHNGGLTVHGFNGYAMDEPIPTLVQVLNGEKPANNPPVRVDFIPGTKWRYSGGGTMIMQQLMIDVTGEPFAKFMRDVVLDKIGMNDSTFELPLPSASATRAATGTYADGSIVRGKWHVYPEMAAAGLWTTPSDLAKFAIEIALSRQGKSNRVLSETMTCEMLRPQVWHLGELALGDEKHPDRMGLGFFLGDETRPDLFGHIGDDAGFEANLTMFGDSGQGAVVMANSQIGLVVGDYLVANIAKEYGWNHVPPRRLRPEALTVLLVVAQLKGISTAIERYWELKKANSPQCVVDENTLLGLGYTLFFSKRLKDAIEVLKLAVQEHPKHWNAYDTLGEMYMHFGDKQRAVENYERSIELNPDNQNGIRMLKKLRQQD